MNFKKFIKFHPVPLAIALILFCKTSLTETRVKCYVSQIESIAVARKNNCTLGTFYDYKSGDILYAYGDDALLIGDVYIISRY